jgi:hypothetical protein
MDEGEIQLRALHEAPLWSRTCGKLIPISYYSIQKEWFCQRILSKYQKHYYAKYLSRMARHVPVEFAEADEFLELLRKRGFKTRFGGVGVSIV